jgi:formamidopyrimidine-DNA glycosylase
VPELPEVETIRRQIAPVVEGKTIEAVEVRDARWVLPHKPAGFEQLLTGRTIVSLTRRGKYFLFNLDDGLTLVMHLRMTGNLLYVDADDHDELTHLRGEIWLSGGGKLAFTDPRRFGTAEIVDAGEYFSGRLGPEPFDDEFDGEYLFQFTRKRKAPIKGVLLDQKVVAGVGNIYADEALFRAGIAPQKRAGRLTRAQSALLADTVRDALNAGIDAKGASIDDFRDAYGVKGSFQDQFQVHLREGLPCPICGTPITKIRVAGRGTYYCRIDQKN